MQHKDLKDTATLTSIIWFRQFTNTTEVINVLLKYLESLGTEVVT